ncbi:MAG: hypothetical protein E7Z99_03790 [Coriobacteriaceae bacterium]|jgi:hypothetical protein|nr:hypothetical protein [Coriobacteriaceae bacterium]
MDFGEIYSFIFATPAGVGILIGATLLLCIIIAFILEHRTRRIFADRGPREETDDWALFDDDEEEPEDKEEA